MVEINGHVNINTVSKLRAARLVSGATGAGSGKSANSSRTHRHSGHQQISVMLAAFATHPIPWKSPTAWPTPSSGTAPYASCAEVAQAKELDGTPVFGNPKLFAAFASASYPLLQWTDSAAEETFARTYEASTVRSRNLRVRGWSPMTVAPHDPDDKVACDGPCGSSQAFLHLRRSGGTQFRRLDRSTEIQSQSHQ